VVEAPGRAAELPAPCGPGRGLFGARGEIHAVAFSPDERYLAAAGDDGLIRLWELGTFEARILGYQGGAVYALAFSRDGGSLAAGGAAGALRVWDIAAGRARSLYGHRGEVRGLAFSSDGRLFSAAEDGAARCFEPASGRALWLRRALGPATSLALSADDSLLFVGDDGGAISAWDLTQPASEPRRFAADASLGFIPQLAISPDGGRVAAASWRRLSVIFDRETEEGRALPGREPFNGVAFSPDGRALAASRTDGSMWLVPDDLPRDPAALREWLARAVEAR
jgi:WD40 repeat protein